jgi:hypothetical protein
VAGAQHAEIVGVDVAVAMMGILIVSVWGFRAERLMAGWTFVQLKTPDLETLRRRIADDDGVVMSAMAWQKYISRVNVVIRSQLFQVAPSIDAIGELCVMGSRPRSRRRGCSGTLR